MFAAKTLQWQCLKTLSISSLLHSPLSSKNVIVLRDLLPNGGSSNAVRPSTSNNDGVCYTSNIVNPFKQWLRSFSMSKGRSMRSKVERRMRKESGRTLREIRRAKKIKKKLMTDEERLIYNLKRAKKKIALLLQKLKKYELPELPPPCHDPELLTAEQLQAYKKIGFKNKNYVPVGVRGVFGGVVQNMHLHWKFHQTVQVCCDNFPKEKIKEMATMLARLSGGIVVNIHNVKTIIMFRGRNYRQPKNLIPINTLTKRKALFKARFEQALDSQKLNIKKMEQELRRKGVNPEDPIAIASIQRVASTFFNAIDKKEGTPYVFHGDNEVLKEATNLEHTEANDDSDQEELDRFIAEIEDAADREWAAEEVAEKEELSKIRYWNREEYGGRFRKSGMHRDENFADEVEGGRTWNDRPGRHRTDNIGDVDNDSLEGEDEWDSDEVEDASDSDGDGGDFEDNHDSIKRPRRAKMMSDRTRKSEGFERRSENSFRKNMPEESSESENMFSDLENAMWESDEEDEDGPNVTKIVSQDKQKTLNKGESDDEYDGTYDKFRNYRITNEKQEGIFKAKRNNDLKRNVGESSESSEDEFSDIENVEWGSDGEEKSALKAGNIEKEEKYHMKKTRLDNVRMKTPAEMDENWDSD